jgi:hypothetical protein
MSGMLARWQGLNKTLMSPQRKLPAYAALEPPVIQA